MIRVWYHSKCYDGFGAAWSAYKALGTEGVHYEAVSYGYPPPEYNAGDTIYIVDFSYDRNTLQLIHETVSMALGTVTVLDHHKTAEAELKGVPYAEFDMFRSGAGMAWDYFHPGKDRPRLIQHIQDRDLWLFEMEGTKEVHAFLCSQPMEFALWDTINTQLESFPEPIYSQGTALLANKKREVEKVCEAAWITELAGHKVATVNTTAHWSEVGHSLLQQYPEAAFAASFTVFNDTVMWSLRGRGDFDVSEVAKSFGGGGHKSAAGFKTPAFSFPITA